MNLWCIVSVLRCRFSGSWPLLWPRGGGFTLIEVMITVAIVGILAAIAYPSYLDQVRRGNRTEAKAVLMENAQFLERNYTVNNCYHRADGVCTTNDGSNVAPTVAQVPATGTAKYDITVAYSTTAPCTLGQCFTLSAAPNGNMTGDACGTLTLNQAGQQGAAGSVAECWQR